uniref:NADH dehydrogenase [ubiquinone] 1 beta subcomplex subunit 11, mitochondrial n=1 Tax=Panagrellus redivivus TaxID=6233 RepID=A0A7E4W0K2_PANRE
MLRVLKPQQKVIVFCRFASHGHHAEDANIERKPDNYRPGSDSYAYENPWPKLNGGRLDWLFQDGWRRPLAKDQGAKTRREWIWFGQVAHDEHKDWYRFHAMSFLLFTVLTSWFTCYVFFLRPDWPQGREWALREAHLEIARRQKAGLPLISKDLVDPKQVVLQLPSEEELRDFEILI